MEHLLAERVKEIMENLGYSPSSFADTIDVPRPIISHILSGRNKPSLDVIQKILMRFPELNPWWLLTGTGEMKQLNLFSDEELESVSLKITEPKQAPISVSPSPQSATEESRAVPKSQIPAPLISPEPLPSPEPIPAPTESASTETKPKNIDFTTPNMPPFGSDKKVEKMIVFYTDKTFSIYHPE